ncbi:hypothetical protein [Sodalinema gerasimenkoae]|uniref:hypothetical protein n=1 Tax=Sodalinema gerasimenkoae TaxID=2862348 RepID=UPI00135711D5|nr:hypothetical protein [Sodalinema gerasimenkoae]
MFTSAILRDPPQISLQTSVGEAIALLEASRIDSNPGEGGVLVMMSQRPEPQPLGLLTPNAITAQLAATPSLDDSLEQNYLIPIVSLPESRYGDIEEVQQLFQEHQVPYILLIDKVGEITGLLSRQRLRSLLFPDSALYSDICDNLTPFFETSLNLLVVLER